MKPEISVVLPIYKSENYLSEAIDSILKQTFKNFELLVICDDPSDETKKILDKYKRNDFRVKPFYQNRKGLIDSLNIGIKKSLGKYIARMDADDISLPRRLEKQYVFMEKNPDVGVCGTNIILIDENRKRKEKSNLPLNDRYIKSNLFFESVLAHPSVIIRKNILDLDGLLYDNEFKHAEDYELWVRLSKITNFANIKEALLLYRIHMSNVGKLHAFDQTATSDIIRKKQLVYDLKLDPDGNELEIHYSLCNYDLGGDMFYLMEVSDWLTKVKKSNESLKIYPEPEFSYIILERFISACNACHEPFIARWKFFFTSCLSQDLSFGFIKKYSYKFTKRVLSRFFGSMRS